MRYLGRTHCISVSWLHEVCASDDSCLEYTQSTDMAADIYTQAYTNAMKWKAVCLLIKLVKLDELPELFAVRRGASKPQRSRYQWPGWPNGRWGTIGKIA